MNDQLIFWLVGSPRSLGSMVRIASPGRRRRKRRRRRGG